MREHMGSRSLRLIVSAWLSVLGTNGFVELSPIVQACRTSMRGQLTATWKDPVPRHHCRRGVSHSTTEAGNEWPGSSLRIRNRGVPRRPSTSFVLGTTRDVRLPPTPQHSCEQQQQQQPHQLPMEMTVDGKPWETEGEGCGGRGLWDAYSGIAGIERGAIALMLAAIAAAAAAAATSAGSGHGTLGVDSLLHWLWAGSGAISPHDIPSPSGYTPPAGEVVRLAPLESLATGAGAGLTRAVSRMLTFPLDTVKTRRQVSKLRPEDRASMPEEMRRVVDSPASFRGVFKGLAAFISQAAPSNAVFFLVYDTLNALGTAAIFAIASDRGSTVGGASNEDLAVSLSVTVLHFMASFVATVPTNLIRTPAEVVKQRLQVGQQTGTSLQAARSIVASEGIAGLFVGVQEQLLREIPFNAIQFATYECMKTSFGGSGLWTKAIIGAASSSTAALATHPIDTVKTRVMTKSVPGAIGEAGPGFLRSAASIAKAEGLTALYLGLLPRLGLVSTGGAFYFFGEELVRQLMGR